MKKVSRTILFLLSVYLVTCGQVWRDKTSRGNSEGNACYQQKAYSEALEKYVEAQDYRKPRPEISYNLGNTLYRLQKYPESIKEYGKSIPTGNPSLDEKVLFNRGNSLFRMGQYQTAVESYQRALELDSKDRDAKHNLELALKKLKDDRQQQKTKGSDQNPKNAKDSPQEDRSQSESDSKQNKAQNQSSQKHESGMDSKSQPEPQKRQASPPQGGKESRGMDPQEALRILDAINEQEKKEQRKQILKLQQTRPYGRDW